MTSGRSANGTGAQEAWRCRYGGRLDPPLLLALDEAALICPVPLERWTADAGGRGIPLSLTFDASLTSLTLLWRRTEDLTVVEAFLQVIRRALHVLADGDGHVLGHVVARFLPARRPIDRRPKPGEESVFDVEAAVVAAPGRDRRVIEGGLTGVVGRLRGVTARLLGVGIRVTTPSSVEAGGATCCGRGTGAGATAA